MRGAWAEELALLWIGWGKGLGHGVCRGLAAAFLLFSAILAIFGRHLYYLTAVFAIFRQLHSHYFRLFWPFRGPIIFIFFAVFSHFWAAAFLLFSAVLASFGRLQLYYFRPFWPFFGTYIFIVFNVVRHFPATAVLIFLPFCPFSASCILPLFFDRLGHFQAAALY